MKTPREVGHAIANTWDASCLLDEDLGWSHGPRCDTATAAIEARDAEHAAEVARWLGLVEKCYGTWPYAGSAADMLRDGEWRLDLARLDAATPAVVPAETPPVTMDTGNDNPWSVREVLARLADAADHLLGDHSCDTHGYEGISYAVDVARRYLNAPHAPAPAVTPVPEGARMLPEDLVREHLAHARSNLEGWSEDGGFYLPTEPDAEERERVRERLRAVIFAYERVLGIDAYAAPPTPSAPAAPREDWPPMAVKLDAGQPSPGPEVRLIRATPVATGAPPAPVACGAIGPHCVNGRCPNPECNDDVCGEWSEGIEFQCQSCDTWLLVYPVGDGSWRFKRAFEEDEEDDDDGLASAPPREGME